MFQRARRVDGFTKRPELKDPTVNDFAPGALAVGNLVSVCLVTAWATNVVSTMRGIDYGPIDIQATWQWLEDTWRWIIKDINRSDLLAVETAVAALAIALVTLSGRSWRSLRQKSVWSIRWEHTVESRLLMMQLGLGIVSGLIVMTLCVITMVRNDTTFLLLICVAVLHAVIATLPAVTRISGAKLIENYVLTISALAHNVHLVGAKEFQSIRLSAPGVCPAGESSRSGQWRDRLSQWGIACWYVIPLTACVILIAVGMIIGRVMYGAVGLSVIFSLGLLSHSSNIFTTERSSTRLIGFVYAFLLSGSYFIVAISVFNTVKMRACILFLSALIIVIPVFPALFGSKRFWSSKPFVGIRDSKVQHVFTTATEYRRRILAFDTDSGHDGEALVERLHAELLEGQPEDSAIAMVLTTIDQFSSGAAEQDTASPGMRGDVPLRSLRDQRAHVPAGDAHAAIRVVQAADENDAHRSSATTRRAASLLLGSAGLTATVIGGIIAAHRRNRPST